MEVIIYLIPIALVLGGAALAAFLWSIKSGQFDDMDGAANRILFDDDDAMPPDQGNSGNETPSRLPHDDRRGR